MNKRTFLRNALGGGMAVAAWAGGLRVAQAAANSSGKTLVVVFQRGGCDGLNAVVPHGEDAYYQLRPNIAIGKPGTTDGALDLDGFFGLHPAMSSLMPWWDAGRLSILPAVQHDTASRSHFDNQHFIEAGMPLRVEDGWLNRHLQSSGAPAPLRAVGFGSAMPQSLRGESPASSLTDLGNFGLGVWGSDQTRLLESMRQLYANPGDKRLPLPALGSAGRTLLGDIDLIRSLDPAGYQAANGAVYPGDGFGKVLSQAALLIKDSRAAPEVICIDHGGWDTHGTQGAATGYQANRLGNLADGLAAFATDLGPRLDDVLVLTMTEFGRTAAENGSGGTDHGHAGAWWLLGGGTSGGVHGDWPGLAPDQLHAGRYLAHSVDFRDVLAEVTRHHLGNTQIDRVLPFHTPQALGLFS